MKKYFPKISDFLTLHGSFVAQKLFSDRVYENTQNIDTQIQRMKTLILGLQSETISLLNAVNYKDHTSTTIDSQFKDSILYESVDIYRYMLAILNNWGVSPYDFARACVSRDLHLHVRKDMETRKWDGKSPVVVFDLDDVVCSFRSHFFDWIEEKHGLKLDKQNKQYYCLDEIAAHGINPETIYEEFVQDNQTLEIPIIESIRRCFEWAKSQGFFVQILTARQENNRRLCYHTFEWLQNYDLIHMIDAVAFSGEKMRWVMKQDWFVSGHLLCAFEDSPKHVSEYISHGVKTIMPLLSYNEHINDSENQHAKHSLFVYNQEISESVLEVFQSLFSKQSTFASSTLS
jgi:hypothetical protein